MVKKDLGPFVMNHNNAGKKKAYRYNDYMQLIGSGIHNNIKYVDMKHPLYYPK
jgi:hypothetical protein